MPDCLGQETMSKPSTTLDQIVITGARQHNLKNISLALPKNKLIVFTGVSGSGKSSLAFDTIYAEGQRRYVESLSAYVRQFLGVMNKPELDNISGLSPAIAIDQKTTSHNPRSTVGTITEIYDYLRLLYARVGHPHCPKCGREIAPQSVAIMVDQILKQVSLRLKSAAQVRLMILSPVVRDRKGSFTGLFDNLLSQGYIQARVDGQVMKLDQPITLIKTNRHTIEAVIDKLTWSREQQKDPVAQKNLKSRLYHSLETAASMSEGLVIVSWVQDPGFIFPEAPTKMQDQLFSEKYACPEDNISLPAMEPRSFSFNSPHGACPECLGLGQILKIDPQLMIAPKLSVRQGAVIPFANIFEHNTWFSRLVNQVAQDHGIDLSLTWQDLPEKDKQILLFGTGKRIYQVSGFNRQGRMTQINETFAGFVAALYQRYQQTSSDFVKHEIERYMRSEPCHACQGARLKPESLAVEIAGQNIAQLSQMTIDQALAWLTQLAPQLSQQEQQIAQPIVEEIIGRLQFLNSVGLNYLSLDRPAATLAGGEAQRIRLASQIGSGLTGVLYVLDEPSIGLHARDTDRLVNSLKYLRDLGNTVIVVEHDEDTIRAADWIVDFGPGAGKHGGAIVAQGPLSQVLRQKKSLTAAYLSGKKKITVSKDANRSQPAKHWLTITNCQQHNLKSIDFSLPLGRLTCVTGVSGSGKSTLVVETLYRALKREFNPYFRQEPGEHGELQGQELVDRVVLIDQSPIGKTPRSNPATYTGVFDHIRQLFAQTPEAKLMGYKPGRFSFNVKGGRCEACQGAGQVKIEMQFLPDVYVTCEVCHGMRYNEQTLQIEYRGRNIAQVLAMTVEEAREFFHAHNQITRKLDTLLAVGLGYMELGQSAPTLSGGEAQRVKLASELSRRITGQTVYILDEPTTGLHAADLQNLLNVLHQLVDQHQTVVVIEHNLHVIATADYVVDLGPEGGESGGQIIAQGSVKQIMESAQSYTGQWLKKYFSASA